MEIRCVVCDLPLGLASTQPDDLVCPFCARLRDVIRKLIRGETPISRLFTLWNYETVPRQQEETSDLQSFFRELFWDMEREPNDD